MLLDSRITLAHGSGGKLSHELIERFFLKKFNNPILSKLDDSALLDIGEYPLAFTTDSYVVKPPFFPGGDIGRLAVCGTVNDLAVSGAVPRFLTCALIMEEGLSLDALERIVGSMKKAADEAGVQIVAGDTKVVERGGADGIFINTAGLGTFEIPIALSESRITPGDKIILSGTIGDHGMAVLSAREDLEFKTQLVSDCAPLNGLISKIIRISDGIKFMRDPTRGGLATTLNEIVDRAHLGVMIEERRIPIRDEVKGICELLGFDPLYIANEGKVVVAADPQGAGEILEAMRAHPLGRDSQIIGEVLEVPRGRVGLKTVVGGTRIVDMLTGDQPPRIC